MLLLDSFLLIIIIGGLHLIKYKYPDFLFFCKGAILFLPPNQQSTQQKPQKKSKKDQQQLQIQILQLNYQKVKGYPKSDEYDRVIFIISSLLIYIPLKWIICKIVDYFADQKDTIANSTFIFIICFVMLVYVIKLGLEIFWISSYNLKYCFFIGIGLNLLFYMLYLTISGFGSYDRTLEWTIQQYKKQLSIIFGINVEEGPMDIKIVLILILVINLIITLIQIPAVIKFGNWYTKTLKQIYYQDQTTSKITDPQLKKQRKQKQQILKHKSKKSIRLLNIYLIAVLVFLFFSHQYSHRFLNPLIIDIIRICIMALMTFINCYTLRDAIQFNGSFAYKFISQYVSTDDAQQKKQLRKRIMPYLYLVWYHKFQFMFRIIIPLILFIMVMDWKYLHAGEAPIQSQPVISHTHCGIQTNQLLILQNLYKCDFITATSSIQQHSQYFLNGALVAGKRIDELSQAKIGIYGLLNPSFMTQFFEQILWYSNITLYAMTIVYILFLRKTVYDM